MHCPVALLLPSSCSARGKESWLLSPWHSKLHLKIVAGFGQPYILEQFCVVFQLVPYQCLSMKHWAQLVAHCSVSPWSRYFRPLHGTQILQAAPNAPGDVCIFLHLLLCKLLSVLHGSAAQPQQKKKKKRFIFSFIPACQELLCTFKSVSGNSLEKWANSVILQVLTTDRLLGGYQSLCNNPKPKRIMES